MMVRIRAFVVGVAKHADTNFDVHGPEESAMRIADWLLGLADVELELHLFLSEGAVPTTAIAAGMADGRVILHSTTARDDIDDFARIGIKKELKRGTSLFVFWSGHGATCSITRDRIFMCGDFEDGLRGRVFNASGFLRRMRSAGYAFKDELILADVCGAFKQLDEVSFEQLVPVDTPQVSCFAGREGKYVKTAEAGGKFTDTALRILAEAGGYPADLGRFVSRIADELDTPDGPAIRLMTSTGRELSEQLIGGHAVGGLPYFDSALALLRRLDVADDDYRLHYERTAVAMKFATVPRTPGARHVLTHLCDLRDDLDAMPLGLLQFMLRLSQKEHLHAAINEWLDTEAPGQHSARVKVGQVLDAERKRRVVLFEVEAKSGTLGAVRPYLCGTNGVFRQDHSFASVITPYKDWEEFEDIVRRTLAEFQDGEHLPSLEIHFAVDPPLLDRPFHHITLQMDGLAIGMLAPVFLRHRMRLLTHDPDWLDNWETYVAMLRTKHLGELRWVRIEPEKPLPEEQGMCYTGFTLPHPAAGTAPFLAKKSIDLILRLLILGTPVLYIRHVAPPSDVWDMVGVGLDNLTSDLSQVDSFAKVFHKNRVRGTDLAMGASLVWDDPHTNPFPSAHGTSDIELNTI